MEIERRLPKIGDQGCWRGASTETHIILVLSSSSSILNFQFQILRTVSVFILKTQWHWSIWISFDFIDFLSKLIWLTNNHQWRQLMMFSSFVKKNMFSQFLNLTMNEMNKSTTMIWLKSLIWLIHHLKIFSIYFTNRHRISKTLNYASKIIFTVFDCVEPSITVSKKKRKFFIR